MGQYVKLLPRLLVCIDYRCCPLYAMTQHLDAPLQLLQQVVSILLRHKFVLQQLLADRHNPIEKGCNSLFLLQISSENEIRAGLSVHVQG